MFIQCPVSSQIRLGGGTHAWAQHCPLVWTSSGSLELASAEQNEELGGGM